MHNSNYICLYCERIDRISYLEFIPEYNIWSPDKWMCTSCDGTYCGDKDGLWGYEDVRVIYGPQLV